MNVDRDVCAFAAAWDQAMIGNDADDIGRFMADEWRIIGADGRVSGKGELLAHIRDGRLTHHTMTTEDIEVRVYGDVAVLIARGVSAGAFDGHPFEEVERQSNVFVKAGGRWQCVLTHLSRISSRAT